MPNIITIGRRLIPAEQIALVEPFDPSANPQFKNEKGFKARVVLINRESMLTEDTPEAFAQVNGFRMLADDGVATNPAIKFKVETFTATEGFKPAKPYPLHLVEAHHDLHPATCDLERPAYLGVEPLPRRPSGSRTH